MKRIISLLLSILLVLGVFNFSVFAVEYKTPKVKVVNQLYGVQVSWEEIEGATHYKVFYRKAGSSVWESASGFRPADEGTSYYTHFEEPYNCYYVFSVVAYFDSARSPYEKDKTATLYYVAAPVLQSISNHTNGVKIAWKATGSNHSYRVYRRGAGDTYWTYIATTTDTSYIDGKATSGNYWRYTVRSVANGYYSSYHNGRYILRLCNPYNIKANISKGGVTISWGKVNGATEYSVFCRGAGSNVWCYLGQTESTTYVDDRAPINQYCRYTVMAFRGDGWYSSYNTNGPVVYTATDLTNHLPVTVSEQYYWFTNPDTGSTSITFNKNGYFTGSWSCLHENRYGEKNPNGTCYFGDFKGRISNVKKINNYTYSFYIADITLVNWEDKPDSWYENGILYERSFPAVLSMYTEQYLYLPNTPLSAISSDIYDDNQYKNYDENDKYLGTYCFYDPETDSCLFAK